MADHLANTGYLEIAGPLHDAAFEMADGWAQVDAPTAARLIELFTALAGSSDPGTAALAAGVLRVGEHVLNRPDLD